MKAIEKDKMLDFPEKWGNIDMAFCIHEGDDFLVWIDSNLDIDWKTIEGHESVHQNNAESHNEILNRAAMLECIPNDQHTESIRLNYKRMIGEGVARSLQGDMKNADVMLDIAFGYIQKRNIEKARFWQLSITLLIGTAVLASLFASWSIRESLSAVTGHNFLYGGLAALCGALGAVLSIMFRIGSSPVTSESERSLHYLEASSRIFAGSLSGALSFLLIKSGIVLSAIAQTGDTLPTILTLSFLAGSSERWVTSIISNFERKSDNQPNRSAKK